MKNKINFLIQVCFLAFSTVHLSSCQAPASREYSQIKGETMGTNYVVTYYDKDGRDFKNAIDSVLNEINQGVSTYIPNSTISLFNQAEDSLDLSTVNHPLINQHFLENYSIARAVYARSDGAFDPTVMPLVNYWGFGYTEKNPITAVDSVKIDSLRQLVGLSKIQKKGVTFIKSLPGIQLDMSGCAKGYGVDQVGLFLEKQGVINYLVDIGGEIKAKGKNREGKDWKIGINVPRENAAFNEIQEAIPVTDISVATSGNYRNFYEVNGVKYSHTINPYTGFPERNTLLSASVFTSNCAVADAYATAFMVVGLEKALRLAKQAEEIEAYFIYSNNNGEMEVVFTEGLEARLKQ